MKVTYKVYGFLKVFDGVADCETEAYYFATEDVRDSVAMQTLAEEDDVSLYDFEYERETEV